MDISYSDFEKVDIRAGRIVDVQEFPEARRPAYKLFVDFGPEIGQRKTSAQVTQNYTREELIGRQVAAVVNFPPKQVGKFMSEILVLGFPDENGNVTLIRPGGVEPTARTGWLVHPPSTCSPGATNWKSRVASRPGASCTSSVTDADARDNNWSMPSVALRTMRGGPSPSVGAGAAGRRGGREGGTVGRPRAWTRSDGTTVAGPVGAGRGGRKPLRLYARPAGRRALRPREHDRALGRRSAACRLATPPNRQSARS